MGSAHTAFEQLTQPPLPVNPIYTKVKRTPKSKDQPVKQGKKLLLNIKEKIKSWRAKAAKNASAAWSGMKQPPKMPTLEKDVAWLKAKARKMREELKGKKIEIPVVPLEKVFPAKLIQFGSRIARLTTRASEGDLGSERRDEMPVEVDLQAKAKMYFSYEVEVESQDGGQQKAEANEGSLDNELKTIEKEDPQSGDQPDPKVDTVHTEMEMQALEKKDAPSEKHSGDEQGEQAEEDPIPAQQKLSSEEKPAEVEKHEKLEAETGVPAEKSTGGSGASSKAEATNLEGAQASKEDALKQPQPQRVPLHLRTYTPRIVWINSKLQDYLTMYGKDLPPQMIRTLHSAAIRQKALGIPYEPPPVVLECLGRRPDPSKATWAGEKCCAPGEAPVNEVSPEAEQRDMVERGFPQLTVPLLYTVRPPDRREQPEHPEGEEEKRKVKEQELLSRPKKTAEERCGASKALLSVDPPSPVSVEKVVPRVPLGQVDAATEALKMGASEEGAGVVVEKIPSIHALDGATTSGQRLAAIQ